MTHNHGGPALSTTENAETLEHPRRGSVGWARGFTPIQSQGAQTQIVGGLQTAQCAGGKTECPRRQWGKGFRA